MSSNGALLGLTVEKGAKLTLTDGGYISPLTVEDGAEDGIQLMGGKGGRTDMQGPRLPSASGRLCPDEWQPYGRSYNGDK